MPLVCLGLSHNTASVEVREKHAFPAHKMGEALIALRDYGAVLEAVMLSTCNRLEIYAELEDYELGVDQLKAFLRNFRHGEVEDISSYLYTLLGGQAIDHLFRVSTGLDSMLIGEAEILGQIKDAYAQAQRANSLGTTLHALFREALEAGKSARSRTRIGGDSTSVATAAVDLVKGHLGSLAGKRVLVVGAGKMGTLAAKRLRAEGVAEIAVVNRSVGKARDVVAALGTGRALELPALTTAIADADVVVTSTGASHFVLTTGLVADAMAGRPDRPLFVVDIAVPRDADPAIGRIDGVRLADIDALRGAVDDILDRRREAIPFVEAIIADHAARFGAWYQSRVAVPVVASLTQKSEAIRSAEVDRLFARCPELTERERTLITGTTLTIVSKLLHGAVTKIRNRAVENRAEAVSLARTLDELFELRLRTDGPRSAAFGASREPED